MEDNPVFLIEFLGVTGLALAWGVWEIWSVRRSQRKPPPGPVDPTG